MHRLHGHPEKAGSKGIEAIERDRRLGVRQRSQVPSPALHHQGTQQETPAMGDHQEMAGLGRDGPIDHQQVTVAHAPAPQAMPPHPHEKGGEGTGDEEGVEIDAVRMGRAAIGDGLGEGELGEHGGIHGAFQENTCSTGMRTFRCGGHEGT